MACADWGDAAWPSAFEVRLVRGSGGHSGELSVSTRDLCHLLHHALACPSANLDSARRRCCRQSATAPGARLPTPHAYTVTWMFAVFRDLSYDLTVRNDIRMDSVPSRHTARVQPGACKGRVPVVVCSDGPLENDVSRQPVPPVPPPFIPQPLATVP